MPHLDTSIDIDAPADEVWSTLTDFARVGEWNSFIREISGRLEVGQRLTVIMSIGPLRAIPMRPKIVRLEPGREFCWFGRAPVRGVFGGEHGFAVDPLDDVRSRFRHFETFSGAMAGPVLWLFGKQIRAGFEDFNAGLKRRVEG